MAIDKITKSKLAGEWTGTVSDLSNLDAGVFSAGFYSIAGNLVTCCALFTVDQTAAGAAELRVSLPIGQDFQAASDLIGVVGAAATGNGGRVEADPTNDLARIYFDTGVATADELLSVSFSYRVTRR